MDRATVVVTGGAGFIGSHIAERLLLAGNKVVIIDDLSGGSAENIPAGCTFYKQDLRNFTAVKKIFRNEKPQLVYHLAANAAENKAQFAPVDIVSRNINTFLNVVVAGLNNGMRRIVVTSSIAVYGSKGAPFKETSRPEPEDIYGISKLAIEDTLKVLSKVHDFEYVIARPHNVYGPRQNMRDPYRNVVTIFMNSVLKNRPITIYGDGEQQRCFTYISDVVEALYKCGTLNIPGMIFNIGSEKAYTLNQLHKVIQKVTHRAIPVEYLTQRPLDVRIAISDHTRALKYLTYKDSVSLEEGLRKTWEYARAIGYQKPRFGGIEIESKYMPKNWKTRD